MSCKKGWRQFWDLWGLAPRTGMSLSLSWTRIMTARLTMESSSRLLSIGPASSTKRTSGLPSICLTRTGMGWSARKRSGLCSMGRCARRPSTMLMSRFGIKSWVKSTKTTMMSLATVNSTRQWSRWLRTVQAIWIPPQELLHLDLIDCVSCMHKNQFYKYHFSIFLMRKSLTKLLTNKRILPFTVS